MSDWNDTYRKDELDGSEMQCGKFQLMVHHYVGCGDNWYASCYGVFEMVTMDSKKLSEAKAQAKAKLQIILEDAVRDLQEYMS